MVQIKKILLLLSCGLILLSCYEDKGNYDYGIVPDGAFEEIPDKYVVLRHEYITINPVVTIQNGEDEYDYQWYLYEGNKKVEVIGNEKDLNFQMTKVGKDDYSIVFEAVSRTTGVPYLKAIKLEVVTVWLWGWYVLKTIDGKTDMDYYSIPDIMDNMEELSVHNLLQSSSGYQMEGEARRICYTNLYREPNPTWGYYEESTRLLLMSSDEMLVYNSRDGAISRYTDDIFYSVPAEKDFRKAFGTFLDIYLVNAGKLYKIKGDMYNVGRFGNCVFAPGGALDDYTLSEYVAGLNNGLIIVFNETTRSFLTMGFTEGTLRECRNNSELPQYPLSGMDYDLLFMNGHIKIGTASALMKHRTKNEYIMLELKISPRSSPKLESHLVNVTEINPGHPMLKAKSLVANSWIPYIYYSNDTEVRITDSSGQQDQFLWAASDGATITGIDFDVDHNLSSTLLIYTQKGDEYAVYIYCVDDFNDGMFVDDEPFTVLRGSGRVVDVKNTAIHPNDSNDF